MVVVMLVIPVAIYELFLVKKRVTLTFRMGHGQM